MQALVRFVLDRRVVITGSVEIAAQQAIALVARFADTTHDARHRHAEQHQCMGAQHQAALEHFRHDLGGAGLHQFVEVVIVLRADDHRQDWGAARCAWCSTFSADAVSG